MTEQRMGTAEATADPRQVTLAADRGHLEIEWDDGTRDRASAGALRAASRSSGAVRARLDGRAVPPPGDLTIVAVNPIGHYALNLVFSDGHDRGIYPWGYLKEVARQESGREGN
ncbi:MAG: DUF971 domain-containing protein [Pseudomonadota bacterium]